jgi:GT2 family glycosyltransferase
MRPGPRYGSIPSMPPSSGALPRPMPRVAAVVVNYNGREITLQALASLGRMTYPAYDLVVVDNGSTDGSWEAVAAAFPSVRQVRVEVNRGSSAGYAEGFRWAFENGYDYVLLLNNDIEVDPRLLDELVSVAESDPRIGCVGPKCYFWSDRKRLWSAGGILRFRESITRERGYGEIDRGQFDENAEVDYVNGCAILIRRQAAEAIGMWDAVFFVCVDDADFCTRLRRAGWRCMYAHRAVLWHRVAYSTGGYTPPRNFQWGRSSAIYVRRYANLWNRLTFFAWTAAALPVAYLRELPRRNQAAVVAKLRGLREGFRAPLSPPPPLAAVSPAPPAVPAGEELRATRPA